MTPPSADPAANAAFPPAVPDWLDDLQYPSGWSTYEHYRIAGHRLTVRYGNDQLADALIPAISHLEDRQDNPGGGLVVHITDSDEVERWLRYVLGSRAEKLFDHGGGNQRPRIHVKLSPDTMVLAYPTSGSLSIFHSTRQQAVYYIRTGNPVAMSERAAPLRAILQWWLSAAGFQIVHAAAVGDERYAVLLAGHGGSGKSTTALRCLASGMRLLGDDSILCRCEPEPMAYSLYSGCSVAESDAAGFCRAGYPVLAREEKSLIGLAKHRGLAKRLPLKALIVPRITHKQATRFEQITPTEAVRSLATSSFINIPGAGQTALSRLVALARRLPCFRLELGTDRAPIPTAIRAILQRTDSSEAGSP